jgi:hypothetical protein
VLLLVSALGCGARPFQPKPLDEVPFRDRAITQSSRGIRVTAAVPSAEESRALFASRLYSRGVQPIWIEIENGRDVEISFLPLGLDPEYYTPIETSYVNPAAGDAARGQGVARYFFERGMGLVIGSGETESGFVFTPVDEGTKSFNVDIIEAETGHRFTFFIPVPGLRLDHHQIDWDARMASPEAFELIETAEIIQLLEALPCCTTDRNAVDQGDPLNIAVIGHPDDIYYAFLRAGWDETETIHRASLWKTAASFLSGGEYRYSPISSLYVFGRRQDVAFQKARDNIHERNHLRLWMTDARWGGLPIWIGQISRDIGVRVGEVRLRGRGRRRTARGPAPQSDRRSLLHRRLPRRALGPVGARLHRRHPGDRLAPASSQWSRKSDTPTPPRTAGIGIINEAGTGFAFPSQTTHLASDTGVDAQRGSEAETQVERWRAGGKLPFPEFEDEQREDVLDCAAEGRALRRKPIP